MRKERREGEAHTVWSRASPSLLIIDVEGESGGGGRERRRRRQGGGGEAPRSVRFPMAFTDPSCPSLRKRLTERNRFHIAFTSLSMENVKTLLDWTVLNPLLHR